MNKELLTQMIDEKLVSVQKHPEADLFIYNYSPKVQYDKLWNEITLQTRGLIMDSEMNYIARPFGKFFNYAEHALEQIPLEPFEVFEKMDGSLGILYWLNNNPFIATRGSFTSEQSQHATEILYNKYSHLFAKINKNHTYLFEIIYPQNRIVVDYGETDDLILLTQIDNETGLDMPVEDIGFKIVKRHDGINDLISLKELEAENKEGFVIRFKSGFRVKVKFAEYCRLHRIITGVSNVVIWEYLSENRPFEWLLEKVPDEFYNWVKKTQTDLNERFNSLNILSIEAHKECYCEDRKIYASNVLGKYSSISSILFNMYSGKDYNNIIWKMCRPVYCKPFKLEI